MTCGTRYLDLGQEQYVSEILSQLHHTCLITSLKWIDHDTQSPCACKVAVFETYVTTKGDISLMLGSASAILMILAVG